MNDHNIKQFHHDHTFAQDQRKPGESRTLMVIALTAVMMVVEIFAGVYYGSMALLADGLHMASHTIALSITAFAYIYARRNANNRQFSFGTGKVNALGGFTGAILLALFALFMAFESLMRLLDPVEIAFNQAILVAIIGLVINGISVFILGVDHHHGHSHDHSHSHSHSHKHADEHQHSAECKHQHDDALTDRHHHANAHSTQHANTHKSDHNLTSAYLHVMADALTSVLAIFALLAAKYFGLIWMDPIMGIVGSLLVAHWSLGLLSSTSAVLLDKQAPAALRKKIKEAIEQDGDSLVADLHVWSIGPDIYSAQLTVVADNLGTADEYKARIPESINLVHIVIETQQCLLSTCTKTQTPM